MSSIVTGILNSTIGLLCSKLRDYTADQLKEGDLNGAQCRQIIVRELDDIKSKLDGLSRKDLLASLSFFKEGVTRLYISLETSGESSGQPSTSKATTEDESEDEGATAVTRVDQIPVMQAERDVLEKAFELSEAIASLNIASKERYKLVKESLKEAKRLATEAFNNVALSTEDRLTASKLRIASRILKGLDDPEAAVPDCLLYLQELQDLPAVQAMFSVWQDSQKGITSRLRARFNKKKRDENIEAIQMINALLLDLIMKLTIRMGLFNWPMIMIGKTFYHPLVDDSAVLANVEEKKKSQVPWIYNFMSSIECHLGCALTSKGEILSSRYDDGLDITRRSGECELLCVIPSEDDGVIRNKIRCFAVDENDNVYILVEIQSRRHSNVPPRHKLLTCDANGNVITYRDLEDIDAESLAYRRIQMSVTKDGMIIICMRALVYIIDSTNARKVNKFNFCELTGTYVFDDRALTVSNKNEIIISLKIFDSSTPLIFLWSVTMDGKLKRTGKVPITRLSSLFCRVRVAFNHVNETIFVSHFDTRSRIHNSFSDSDTDTSVGEKNRTTIFTFSNTGEFLHQFNVPGKYEQLISHPNGLTALVNADKAFMLQL